jgi:hypothetical protein
VTSRENEIKDTFEAQERKYELPSGLLKKIYDTESDYLHQNTRTVSRREIMRLILESVPRGDEDIDRLLTKHREAEE